MQKILRTASIDSGEASGRVANAEEHRGSGEDLRALREKSDFAMKQDGFRG